MTVKRLALTGPYIVYMAPSVKVYGLDTVCQINGTALEKAHKKQDGRYEAEKLTFSCGRAPAIPVPSW